MRRRLPLLALAVLLSAAGLRAQAPLPADDLLFLEKLRERKDYDLALQYLQRLRKSAPPALARELALEVAKTRLKQAGARTELGKRLAEYKEVRDELEAFLKANPTHPRAAEANLDIARVLNQQGRTELSAALLTEDKEEANRKAREARATLGDAGKRLEAAVAALTKRRDKLSDSDAAERRRLDDEIAAAQLERGLNLFDQSETYLDAGGAADATKRLEQAADLLQPLADGPPTRATTWKAKAWLGRCLGPLGREAVARKRYAEVLTAKQPQAAEGRALADYFSMLSVSERPDAAEAKKLPGLLIDRALEWRKAHPELWMNSPEGYGVGFLLAKSLLDRARSGKVTLAQANRDRADARDHLRRVERGDNDFTLRARVLKLTAVREAGGFSKKVPDLATFEDCYERAQYEVQEIREDAKAAKDPAALEGKRRARLETALAALRRGLGLPAAKGADPAERNNARAMLAFYNLSTGLEAVAEHRQAAQKYKEYESKKTAALKKEVEKGKYKEKAALYEAGLQRCREALKVGEALARDDPGAAQAGPAAMYALEAAVRLVAERQAAGEGAAAERQALLRLARYLEQRWPRDPPGDLARHQVGLLLLKEENLPEGVKKLSGVSPAYSSYPFAMYQLAEAALKADKDKRPPIAGDRDGDYRRRALQALEGVPASALGSDPATSRVYVLGKATLGREWFKAKRYREMDELAGGLLARLGGVEFDPEKDQDKAIRDQLRSELVDIRLYARYGLADAAFAKGDSGEVLKLVGPVLAELTKAGATPEKAALRKNQPLANALLTRALRSSLQLGDLPRTREVRAAMKAVQEDDDADTFLKLLLPLMRRQMDEAKKEGKEAAAKAAKGFESVLQDELKGRKELTADFLRLQAEGYSALGRHDQAVALLGKVPAPGKSADEATVLAHRRVQLTLLRELRLSGAPADLKKAEALLAEVQGTAKNPGWGLKSMEVVKEKGMLLEARGKYLEAFNLWSGLVKQLAKRAEERRELYLDCYYHMVYSYVKYAKGLSGAKRDEALTTAARRVVDLEKNYEDFGSEASRQRFQGLLKEEPALKEQYAKLKKSKKK